GGMVVSMIICAVYPTMHELRPAVMANNNFCTSIVKSLYSIDNAAVLLPSMHVLISCLLCIAIWTSESLKKNTLIKISSLILSVAICFSTVLIKQHSILDVILALILVMPFYWFGDFVGRKTS
ncbi:MAG: phosphatase PAP2 family protein, partial [Clostridia bacterium]